MNNHKVLEHVFNEILQVINPLSDDWSVRIHIIDELRAIVSTVESLRGATVEPFGSFLSNLFSRWGDLDISIELSSGLHIISLGRKSKLSLLADVHKALKARGGWLRRLQLVSHARVPILKFESHQSISCDISINNLSGQMKSKFLLWISLIDPRFRDMVLLVKEWAKAHNINNSKAGTLNSYSLSLLVVFHFQTCWPAILPPLNEIYPGNIAEELRGVRSDIEKHIEEVCTANITRFSDMRRTNRSSLPELFISFLAKFCEIEERAKVQGISTFTGQWEDIDKNMRWLPKTHPFFIEDPLEQPENTARAVSARNLTKICQAFRATHELLSSPSQSQRSLIPSLVGPQILSVLLPQNPRGANYFNRVSHYQNGAFRGSQQHPKPRERSSKPKPVTWSNARPFYPRRSQAGSSTGQVREEKQKNNGVTTGISVPFEGGEERSAGVQSSSQGKAQQQQVWRPKHLCD